MGLDGTLYAWGDDTLGQLGDGNTNPPYFESGNPQPVTLPDGAVPQSVSAAGNSVYVITSVLGSPLPEVPIAALLPLAGGAVAASSVRVARRRRRAA